MFTAQCLPSSCRARRECAAPSTMAPAARPGAAGAHVVQQWGGSSGSDMGSMLGYQRSTPSAMPCQPAQSLCCLHDASCCCSVRSSGGVPLMHSLHPTPYPTRPPNHPAAAASRAVAAGSVQGGAASRAVLLWQRPAPAARSSQAAGRAAHQGGHAGRQRDRRWRRLSTRPCVCGPLLPVCQYQLPAQVRCRCLAMLAVVVGAAGLGGRVVKLLRAAAACCFSVWPSSRGDQKCVHA